MDILLTHAYFLAEDDAEKRIMKPYPTLGILYLSSYLKSKGFAVDVFDTTFSTKKEFQHYVDSKHPRVVGISINLMTKLNALDLIEYCKARGCTVIVGGPEVPCYAEEFIKHGADVAVIGEGEITLQEVLLHLQKNKPHGMRNIAGIVYRESDGTMMRTAPRPLVSDLDSLPNPDRDTVNLYRYLATWKEHHGRSSVSLLCARGCPYTCTWCSRSVFGDTHRRRSVKHVVDEIEMLRDRYNPDQLWFADDVFTINYRWFFAFHEEMKRRGITIPFECISRADRLNDDVLRAMADLGAFRIWFGSESGSQRILDAMQRRVTVEEIRSATKMAQRYGIQAGLFVMLGYPGEELEDIDATVDHLKKTQADTYLTTVAYPIKGTDFYEDVQDRLFTNLDWRRLTDRSRNFRGRHSKRFYWFATRHLVNEVHLDKLRHNGRKKILPLVTTYAKAKAARIGMRLTARERT